MPAWKLSEDAKASASVYRFFLESEINRQSDEDDGRHDLELISTRNILGQAFLYEPAGQFRHGLALVFARDIIFFKLYFHIFFIFF